jgi:hypothetical protein
VRETTATGIILDNTQDCAPMLNMLANDCGFNYGASAASRTRTAREYAIFDLGNGTQVFSAVTSAEVIIYIQTEPPTFSRSRAACWARGRLVSWR